MVKWLKITENQYFGFWMLGLVLFALQEVPYMLMPFLKLKTNPIMNMQESFVFLDVCEKILGSLCVFLMTFVIQKNVGFWNLGERNGQIGFGLAVVVLLFELSGLGDVLSWLSTYMGDAAFYSCLAAHLLCLYRVMASKLASCF